MLKNCPWCLEAGLGNFMYTPTYPYTYRTMHRFSRLALQPIKCLYCSIVSNNYNNFFVGFSTIRKSLVFRNDYRIVKLQECSKIKALQNCVLFSFNLFCVCLFRFNELCLILCQFRYSSGHILKR